jgi:hypothetical protein
MVASMCCFVLVLGFLGPRIAFLWVWLATNRVDLAFSGGFWLPLLGMIFLPWTALAYVAAWAPLGGVSTLGWCIVGLGFLLDIASYSSRSAQQRYSSGATA